MYNTQPKKHEFDFTGLLKCKECDSFIPAEKHTKQYKKTSRTAEYIYYRCVKKKGDCSQGCIRQEDLEPQLRKIVWKCGLSDSCEAGMMKLWHNDNLEAKDHVSNELAHLQFLLKQLIKS